MPAHRVVYCKRCGRHLDECGPLSARKLCWDCSVAGPIDAMDEIAAGAGPIYDRYVNGMTAYAAKLVRRSQSA